LIRIRTSFFSHYDEDEEDDEDEVNDEIMRVANAIEEEEKEEVAVKPEVVDGRIACNICSLKFTSRGINRHKSIHKKNKILV
jgi:hypothetical protein